MNGTRYRRVVEAGDSALLLQIGSFQTTTDAHVFDADVNREAVGIAATLRRKRPMGVHDEIATFRSVAVFFDPLEADVDDLKATLESCEPSVDSLRMDTRTIDVPVVYGGVYGSDLADVAAFAGCDADTVVERHVSRTYRVFMLGFLPGFPYMGPVDESIAAPRRSTPRISVPSGSVGIAGQQTGIYPSDSPGGWQIIGRTPLTLFDPTLTQPTLFEPGDAVRFVRATNEVFASVPASIPTPRPSTAHAASAAVTVLKPGLLSTIQDRGRWGYQHLGVPPAGPMDPTAHNLGNLLVGNPGDAATIEATLVGPELMFEGPVRVAITGADLSPELDGIPVPSNMPTGCTAGSVLRFGARKGGGRSYVAFAGGIDVPMVLGSRATHVQSGMGGVEGRPLRAGDRLALGVVPDPTAQSLSGSAGRPDSTRVSGSPRASSERDQARYTDLPQGARLRVMRGPQADLFDEAAFERLRRTRFIVSPHSNRMGYRLAGARVPVASAGDMISDATFAGAIQVPPSGEPILLMSDRQTTGGYPQIAVVISADLPAAGQLLPGDWIEFELCTRAEAVAALGALRRLHGSG